MKVFDRSSIPDIFENRSHWASVINESVADDGGCIIRGLYDENFILNFKKWVFEQRVRQGLSGNQKYTRETKNHFKVVDKNFEDPRPTRFVLCQYFPWNKTENAEFHDFFIQFMQIRNILNGIDLDVGIFDTKQFISWISVLQYRSGGDFLACHKDKYKFQAILIMSQFGKDFTSGGQYILSEDMGSVFTEKLFRIGDLVMLKSDIPHGVYPIDQDAPLSDNSIDGRWIMFSPYNDPAVLT